MPATVALENAASAAEIADPITGDPIAYRRLIDDPLGRPFILVVPPSAAHWRVDRQQAAKMFATPGVLGAAVI